MFQLFQSADVTLDDAGGAEGLRMPLSGLVGKASTSFIIDVGDRLTASALGQIRVSGPEMQGADVTVTIGSDSYNAAFDGSNMAVFGERYADKT